MRKTRTPRTRRRLALACALLVALLPSTPRATSVAPADDKLKAEDVVAKHQAAIGPEAARGVAVADAEYRFAHGCGVVCEVVDDKNAPDLCAGFLAPFHTPERREALRDGVRREAE